MIELNLKSHNLKLNLPSFIKEKFNFKSVIFSKNINDKRNLLRWFLINDYKKNELIFLDSYSENNLKILNDFWLKNSIIVHRNPHCFVECEKWKSFYSFSEMVDENFPFFYKCDIVNNKIYLIQASDLGIEWIQDNGNFSPTVFRKDDYMILSFISDIYKYIIKINIYNIKNNEVLYKIKYDKKRDYRVAHSIKEINWFIFSSDFEIKEVYIKSLNKKMMALDYLDLFYPYYKNYLKIKELSIKLKEEEIIILFNKLLSNIFKNYNNKDILTLFKNIKLDIVSFLNLTIFKADYINWIFRVFNPKNKIEDLYETTLMWPAHFEIDKKWEFVYISSHNFSSNTNLWILFFWPACIDKFKINKDWTLKYISNFINNSWFRFTSHKIFINNWEEYICTIWEPNRLFFIRTKDMSLFYYFDLFNNNLSDNLENNLIYINNLQNSFSLIALDVSDNWDYIIISWKKELIFFDFANKKISHIENIVNSENTLLANTHLEHFY